MQEPARVEGVRDEPGGEPAVAQRVQERVGLRAHLARGLPGGVLGREEPVEGPVVDLHAEALEQLADHAGVLDLVD